MSFNNVRVISNGSIVGWYETICIRTIRLSIRSIWSSQQLAEFIIILLKGFIVLFTVENEV